MFAENFRTRNSLTLFQQGLGESESLLGVSVSKPAGDRLGAELYHQLSDSLDPADAAKSSWPLPLDGVLFELLPLASGYKNWKKDRREESAQLSRLVSGGHALQRSSASRWTTAGVARPIQSLEGTAARRDNCLQALSAERGPSVGDGLPGLSRAWMIAGAGAMDGDMIPAFYRNLRVDLKLEILRRSQTQLIHSGTWQAAPFYWAAFRVTGGGR